MDIVERLRERISPNVGLSLPPTYFKDALCQEAADEIERLRKEIHEYDDMIRDAGWYLTDDGGNSYKSADEIISHFLMAKDKARAEQIAR